MKFKASLAASSVGSFPHTDISAVCDLILRHFPEIPVWPQLPATNLREQMEIQYSEGMPCTVIDESRERMYFQTDGDITGELEKFYENIITENFDYFAITEAHSRGIPAIASRLEDRDNSGIEYFKMQVTGPVSFALTLVDENKRAIYYNDIFRDVIVKAIAMKARWQLRKFKNVCENRICIIDEPILSAFGSSTYVSVRREDVIEYIAEIVGAIHADGGISGIHCCGNTEWTIPLEAGVEILNFDAYEYGTSIILYHEALKSFIGRGGILSWGIVPTSETVNVITTSALVNKFEKLVDELAAKGIDKEMILHNSLITASCGTGSVPISRAERIATETRNVSDRLREKYKM